MALDVIPRGDRAWSVALSAGDFLGALSFIVGLFTAHRLSIASADILTVRTREPPAEPRARAKSTPRRVAPLASPPTRRLLDVFEVRALAEPPPDLWPRFRDDFAALVPADRSDAAKDELIDRVSEAIAATGPAASTLWPMAIEVTNPPGASSTRLAVRSADTPGFLFAFVNALADFTIDVEHAEIRTVGGEAHDTFWVTDVRGRPIVDEQRVHELRVATTLIKQFTYLLPRSPNPGQALRQFNALVRQMLTRPAWTEELANLEAPAVLERLADLMGVSRFLWEDFLRMQHESLFPLVLAAPAVAPAATKEQLRSELDRQITVVAGHDERVQALNAFKDREMFRIDLRHVVGQSAFEMFSRELTGLAEVAIDAACALAIDELTPKFGRPRLADDHPCSWCVCALGKFGGGELGFGSDLELIVVYEDDGRTDGSRSIVNGEYFINLVQVLLRTLWARQEGIFEIDLRLRPFGRAGALASSLDGFARYYADGGAAEQFERLALVRLRPVAGDSDLGQRVARHRDAFVYSGRPLDLENIQHLRHRQATELVPRGQINAKYSPGGVVDLEYFVQAWQIATGAADPTTRVPGTLEAIDRLARGGYLEPELAHQLAPTYFFLRRLIDGLRVVRGNAKDLSVPPPTSREFAYLTRRLKLASPAALWAEIEARMAFAESLWSETPPPASSTALSDARQSETPSP